MDVRTYQAYSMAQALAAVKRDLGADAVILSTRSFRRGGFLGLGRRTIIEVSARRAEAAPARTKRQAASRKPSEGVRRTNVAGLGQGALNIKKAYRQPLAQDAPTEVVTDTDRERTRTLALALAEQHERKQRAAIAVAPKADAKPSLKVEPPAAAVADVPVTAVPSAATPEPTVTVTADPEPVARRFVLKSCEASASAPETRATATPATSAGAAAMRAPRRAAARTTAPAEAREPVMAGGGGGGGRDDASADMHNELSAIRKMVGEVLQNQSTGGGGTKSMPSMPQELFDSYLKLISQDLSEDLADRVVESVRADLDADACSDADKVREAMLRQLAAFIPCADAPISPESPDGRPLTVALIGPTGVGKTTTLAKLAASFKLRHGRKVGLITADTYRIAAVDQLRTYADIIGLPLEVALTPADMRKAVHSMSEYDVILIDTAGRSQRDHSRLDELRAFLDAASPHEVHLVLSSTASEKVLLQESEAFAAVGADKVVLTKLDEAVSFGMLVNVIRTVGKELSFFTTGQEVPDHIELGRPDRLAELILDGELSL
ncbi:MAG: flagellar biosynthesis protein FlhF [Planctomycetota bacterium]